MSQLAKLQRTTKPCYGHEQVELAASHRPIVQIDVCKYQQMIDDPRLTEEGRETLVRSIWALLMAMVDSGLVLETQPDDF